MLKLPKVLMPHPILPGVAKIVQMFCGSRLNNVNPVQALNDPVSKICISHKKIYLKTNLPKLKTKQIDPIVSQFWQLGFSPATVIKGGSPPMLLFLRFIFSFAKKLADSNFEACSRRSSLEYLHLGAILSQLISSLPKRLFKIQTFTTPLLWKWFVLNLLISLEQAKYLQSWLVSTSVLYRWLITMNWI